MSNEMLVAALVGVLSMDEFCAIMDSAGWFI